MMRSPVAVDVSRVSKSFQLPLHRPDTLKERAVHPFSRETYRELKVLEEISFDVKRGEFFGLVGRNGSGKSTLLKLIASIYRADSGRIRVAGLVAPVIELGVGFQSDLAARENVVLNGLMMGLTGREARRRFDEVMDFAELHDFVDLKLKNYSSGMRARLAFAIVMQADPDIMLLDEVLAVGDAPFARRCEDAFEEMKRSGRKTVVLVSHAVSNIKRFCDRAMLLDDGRVRQLGDATEVARKYTELVPAPPPVSAPPNEAAPQRAAPARVVGILVLGTDGERIRAVHSDEPIRLHIATEADGYLEAPRLHLKVIGQGGEEVFAPAPIELSGHASELAAGERVVVAAVIENRLAPGRYLVTSVIASGPHGPDGAITEAAVADFEVVSNGRGDTGLVSLDYDVHIARAPSSKEQA
jgi:ABC-type polysaccharide/polyol phosphate transport system ATPase subunit